MNTHIVRVNEKIERIASIYNLSTEEIIKINHHIKDWNNLIPGTKLRLPEIPEIVQTELDNTEPFIEEYYPKLEATDYIKPVSEPHPSDEIVVNVLEQNEKPEVIQNINNTMNKNKKYTNSHY